MFLFRSRVRTEREERKIEGDLRRSQRACEQLDSEKVREPLTFYIMAWHHIFSLYVFFLKRKYR